jgi:hypothetical protein
VPNLCFIGPSPLHIRFVHRPGSVVPNIVLLSFLILSAFLTPSLFSEYLLVFREMSTPAQGAASLALRNAILNWAVDFPQEFNELWTSHLPGLVPQSAFASTSSGFSSKMSEVFASTNSGFPLWEGRVNDQSA